jgi:hypothetical protein
LQHIGGKDNFAVDRVVGDKVLAIHPETVLSVQANRKFLARSVRYLAAGEGIRQFLDVGTGLPSANNTHEVDPGVVRSHDWGPDPAQRTPRPPASSGPA